jgi:hypothetical protein
MYFIIICGGIARQHSSDRTKKNLHRVKVVTAQMLVRFLEYTYGLSSIYSEADIDAAKTSPSFEREYNLKYLGLIGNVIYI